MKRILLVLTVALVMAAMMAAMATPALAQSGGNPCSIQDLGHPTGPPERILDQGTSPRGFRLVFGCSG